MNVDDVLKSIREGTEEQAREAAQRLVDNSYRMAAAAIIARNFSHNFGHFIERLPCQKES